MAYRTHLVRWLIVIASIFVVGRAGASPLEPLRFSLNWLVQGQHAVYYLGLEKGFYADEGIDLTIKEGQGTATVLKMISEGHDVIGLADYGSMIKAVTQGLSVTAIYGIMQDSPMAIISRADHPITSPKGLEGKSVAMSAAESSAQLFPSLLSANGVDAGSVNIVNPSAGAKDVLLLQGRVDAITGYSNLNVPVINAMGLKTVYFRYADFGINTMSNGIVANPQFLLKHGDLVRRFLRATTRAYKAAMKNPAAAVDALMKHYPERKKQRDVYIEMLKATFPLLQTKNNAGHPIGWMSRADWQRTQDVLFNVGVLSSKKSVDTYFTNDFIDVGAE